MTKYIITPEIYEFVLDAFDSLTMKEMVICLRELSHVQDFSFPDVPLKALMESDSYLQDFWNTQAGEFACLFVGGPLVSKRITGTFKQWFMDNLLRHTLFYGYHCLVDCEQVLEQTRGRDLTSTQISV